MSATLAVTGVAALRTWLLGTVAHLRDRATLHERAGRAVTGWVDRNFADGGRLATETSAGWPALAASTLAARRRAGLGDAPLVATGRLRAGVRLRSDGTRAVVDDPVPYAPVHQLGLGVPARPFLPTPAQAGRIVQPVAEAFVREALP